LQKLFFEPGARGLGMARYMVVQALKAARAAGYRYCYLETISATINRRLTFDIPNRFNRNTGYCQAFKRNR
ncbi:hypothetical protein ACJ8HD_24295, partial [Serratia sp. CY39337]